MNCLFKKYRKHLVCYLKEKKNLSCSVSSDAFQQRILTNNAGTSSFKYRYFRLPLEIILHYKRFRRILILRKYLQRKFVIWRKQPKSFC